MTTFYSNSIAEKEITLDENDSRHAIRSLRLKLNDSVQVVSGKGELFHTKILIDHPKKTVLSIVKKDLFKADIPLVLAFCPTKNNDKNELVVEKAVEIGVTKILPIFSQNSERRKWKTDRMNKIAIAAMKQSGRYWLPEIIDPMNFDDFITTCEIQNRFIAHCRDQEKVSINSIKEPKKPQLILIGPEGDFSKEEINVALKNQFKAVDIGKNRLRTETACITALSILKID